MVQPLNLALKSPMAIPGILTMLEFKAPDGRLNWDSDIYFRRFWYKQVKKGRHASLFFIFLFLFCSMQ
jgi:hypothetical protein